MPYANQKIREINYSMANTTYNSTADMINNLQNLKGKLKLKFYRNHYDERNIRRQSDNFQFEEDPSSKNVEGVAKIYHDVLMLMKFLQIKPSVKKTNIRFYDLYYTVNKKQRRKKNCG